MLIQPSLKCTVINIDCPQKVQGRKNMCTPYWKYNSMDLFCIKKKVQNINKKNYTKKKKWDIHQVVGILLCTYNTYTSLYVRPW